MASACLIYWSSRRGASARWLAFARITALLFVLIVWLWTWTNLPSSAFTAPAVKHMIFALATAGLAAATALALWRTADARRSST